MSAEDDDSLGVVLGALLAVIAVVAQVGDFKRLLAENLLPFPVQGTLAIHQAHDGLGGGCDRSLDPFLRREILPSYFRDFGYDDKAAGSRKRWSDCA